MGSDYKFRVNTWIWIDELTKIQLVGNNKTVEKKLRNIFGPSVEIEFFQDED